jgi:glycosyltransferase involved in cell wall biosynthesis
LLRTKHRISIDFQPFESPALTDVLYEPGRGPTKAALVLRDAIRRRETLAAAPEYDAIIIYREACLLGPAIYERLLARARTPLIFDFDDAIWMTGEGSVNGPFSLLRFPGKTATICGLASAVTVGNQYLAEYAARHSREVHVIPTTVDVELFPVQPTLPNEEPFTIVWSGSLSTLPHLETARAALERLARRRRTVLRVICSRPPDWVIEGVETEFVPWSADGEATTLGRSHVAIMPLPDNDFTRGKCGAKALISMAIGLPVVISPVGVNSEIVSNGRNGLLANTVDEWVEALDSLAGSRPLRERLGLAGRTTVEERYSAQIGAAKFAEVVDRLLAGDSRR